MSAPTATTKPSGALRERVATALILAPIGIAAVILLPQGWFALALAILFLVGVREWAVLCGWRSPYARAAILGAHLALFAHVWLGGANVRQQIVGCGVVFWFLVPVWLWRFRYGERPSLRVRIVKSTVGFLTIVPAFSAAISLHGDAQGPWWVLFVVMLIWCADTCAYFAGRRFGTTKLAPNISPGKTTAGVYGALIGSALFAVLTGHYGLTVTPRQLPVFAALCLVTVVFSVVGDLLESLIKRHAAVKDSGDLFPGHGGALDRFDSLFAALPIFVAGRAWLLP